MKFNLATILLLSGSAVVLAAPLPDGGQPYIPSGVPANADKSVGDAVTIVRLPSSLLLLIRRHLSSRY
jgi:uncharacterized protein YceK